MDLTTLNTATRHFPLLGRPRPPCPSLPARVQEVVHLAHTAQQQSGNALHEAAHTLNKAALLAGDCGLTDEARRLCWEHIDLYRAAGHRLTPLQARYMLEPVVNLARLHIRDKAPESALRILKAMHHAAMNRIDLVVDDRVLPMAHLIDPSRERNKLREWVWLQLLVDGIRALALAGQWTEAADLARTHRGIGAHLMEGRQAAILAARLNGTPDSARDLLHASTITEPWEHQVASCLEALCSTDHPTSSRTITALIHMFQGSTPVDGYAVFRARLGLTVTILAHPCTAATAPTLLTQAATEAIAAGDGYAARTILNHGVPDTDLPAQQRHILKDLVTGAGLGSGLIPPPLRKALENAIGAALQVLSVSLDENDHQ